MNSKIFCLLLTFMLLQVAYTDDCELCTYSINGKENDDDGSCTPCDEGTCTPDIGTQGTNQSVCIARKCKAGKISDTGYDLDGLGKGCDDCEDGTSSLEGSTYCNIIFCDYGTYSNTGYYDSNISSQCDQCPENRTTSKKNTIGYDQSVCDVKLIKCPAGKWSSDGYYSEGNEAECEECKTGTYSNEGSTSCDLRPCDQGTYSKTGYYDIKQHKECQQKCPKGKSTKQTNTKGTNNSVCDVDVKVCPDGKYSKTGYDLDGNGKGCNDCTGDSYSKAGSNKCNFVICDYGFYSDTGYYNPKYDTQCTKCPIGKSTEKKLTKGANSLVCTKELERCPAGQWSTTGFNGNSKGTECQQCANGTSSDIGSQECRITLCPIGYYSERGYYYNNKENDNDCKPCPRGKSTKKQNTQGKDDSACSVQLKQCPQGYYSDNGYDEDGKGEGCDECELGTYSIEGSTGCNHKPCGFGFYSQTGYYLNNKESECTKCPLGKSTLKYIQKGTDDSACDEQLNVDKSSNNETDLQPCDYGFYSDTGYYDAKTNIRCNRCPENTFTLGIQTVGKNDSVCIKKHDENVDKSSNNEKDLRPCDYGFYSETGYYDAKTNIRCKPCPENTFTEGIKTIGKNDSVCIKKHSEDIDKSSNNETESDAQSNKSTSSSIIIQITLSFILLVTIF